MRIVNMHEAKTHLSKLVNAVLHGDEIIIALAGKPVAKLSPIKQEPKRLFGVLKKKIKVSDDFDDPLPNEIINEFEG